MEIFPIHKGGLPNNRQRVITPKTTGYAAAAGLCLSLYSGISKNKSLRKAHKPLAYSAAVLTAVHIGITEYLHGKYRRK